MNDDEIKALEEKCKKVIAESLRREHEALLNEMLRLKQETQRLHYKTNPERKFSQVGGVA